MSTDKFLSTGGAGITDLGNGSATIFASTLGAKNLDPSRPVKTNAVSQLVSDNLEISDINNLQSELDAGISNPLTSSLNFSNFSSVNKASGEFVKKSTGSTGNATAGSIKIYANTDGQFHSVDESGTDKIIGNSGHVLGPNSVSADGKVAIYNGTTGKVLKDSNLTVDTQNHLDISGNFARYQAVDYLNPTEVNSLAAVGYVQQERDSSNSRITTLETNTTNISYDGANTLIENNEVYIGNALYTGLNTLDSTSGGGYVIHNQCSEFLISGWGGNGITDISYKSNYPTGAGVGFLINSVDIKSQDNTGTTSIGSQTRCFASELWTPTSKGTKYEVNTIPNGSMILGNRLKIDGDNTTTLTADTINMDATFLNTKAINVQSLLPGATEKIQIINFGLDQQINADGNLKIESQGDLNIQAAGIGTVSIPDLRATGTLLLQLGNRIRSVDISNNLSDLEIDASSMTLDIPLVTQRNSVSIEQHFFKLGTSPDGTLINRRKVQAVDSTLATADLFVETVTASGDITNTNHAADYEIKTSVDGSTVKNTRLKIAANGRTDIYGPDIFLDGNTRVSGPGFFELNFGTLADSYRFPFNRPQAGQVLTGGTGDGTLTWEKTGYQRVNTNDVTTASLTFVVMTDMTLTPGAGKYLVLFSGNFTHGGGKGDAYGDFSIFSNGVEILHSHRYAWLETDPIYTPLSTQAFTTIADGQTIDVRWRDVASEDPRCVEKSLLLVRIS